MMLKWVPECLSPAFLKIAEQILLMQLQIVRQETGRGSAEYGLLNSSSTEHPPVYRPLRFPAQKAIHLGEAGG